MLGKVKLLFDWAIHALSVWMPEPAASLIVILGICFVVLLPLSALWSLLHARWWRRITPLQRKLFLFSIGIAFVLLARDYMSGTPRFRVAGLASIAAAVAIVLWSLHPRPRPDPEDEYKWEVRSETAPGFPVVGWWQEVDTGYLQKNARNTFELYAMRAILIAGPVIGWIINDWEGAGVGLLIALFLLPAANRYSTPPKLENVGGYVPMPSSWGQRQPTEVERLIDNEPITEVMEAQAYVSTANGADLIAGEPRFIVQWRSSGGRNVTRKFDLPWDAVLSLELDSFDRLFVDRVRPLPYRAPSVIIARVETGIIEVARDMGLPANQQRLFANLTRHFGVERRAVFMRERQTERKRLGLDRPAAPPPPPADEPGPRKRPKL